VRDVVDFELALTLHQPWGSAIVRGAKEVENRVWAPSWKLFGRRIWIHAGLTYDREGAAFCARNGFKIPATEDVTFGAIIGSVRVVGFAETAELSQDASGLTDAQRAAVLRSKWFVGPCGWLLAGPYELVVPVFCRGFQKLWRVPEGVQRQLARVWPEEARKAV